MLVLPIFLLVSLAYSKPIHRAHHPDSAKIAGQKYDEFFDLTVDFPTGEYLNKSLQIPLHDEWQSREFRAEVFKNITSQWRFRAFRWCFNYEFSAHLTKHIQWTYLGKLERLLKMSPGVYYYDEYKAAGITDWIKFFRNKEECINYEVGDQYVIDYVQEIFKHYYVHDYSQGKSSTPYIDYVEYEDQAQKKFMKSANASSSVITDDEWKDLKERKIWYHMYMKHDFFSGFRKCITENRRDTVYETPDDFALREFLVPLLTLPPGVYDQQWLYDQGADLELFHKKSAKCFKDENDYVRILVNRIFTHYKYPSPPHCEKSQRPAKDSVDIIPVTYLNSSMPCILEDWEIAT